MTEIDAAIKSMAANSAKSEAELEIFEFEFHPLAEMFPVIDEGELALLKEDIRKNGMLEPITLFEHKILDGRNRYLAAKAGGLKFTRSNFRWLPPEANARDYVISANIRRRHLTAKQKREVIADLMMFDPTKSDRQIAEVVKVSKGTVGAVREELEATGQIGQLETRTGKDGKKRTTKGKGGGGRPKGKGGGSKGKAITYAQVIDAKTAVTAYGVLEEHLLDALQDLNKYSSFAHADEYALRTIEKLQEKLNEMQPEEEQEAA